MSVRNVLLVGVGGQGIILASKILSSALVKSGFDVKMSEVHGMAQRGGSVTTQVRFGKKVYSPIIGRGEADILVAFEKMEAMRWLEYLKPDGCLIVNDYEIPSAPILAGKVGYPEGLLQALTEKVATKAVKAAEIAAGLKNMKVMNIVMLGALAGMLKIEEIDWVNVVRDSVKKEFSDINVEAFMRGINSVKES